MGRRKFASIGVYRSLVDSPALKEKPRRGAWVRVIGSGGRTWHILRWVRLIQG